MVNALFPFGNTGDWISLDVLLSLGLAPVKSNIGGYPSTLGNAETTCRLSASPCRVPQLGGHTGRSRETHPEWITKSTED